MPTNFPTSLDTTTNLPTTIADATTQATNHPAYHNTEDGALIALETKIGIGAATPTNGKVLTGGVTPGTSTWATPGVGAPVRALVTDYGARGNAFKRTDGAIGAGGTVITTAAGINALINNADEAAGLVKVRFNRAGANPDTLGTRLTWAGWWVQPLVATVTAHTDTTITVTPAATTAVASGGTFWCGTDDGPAIRSALLAFRHVDIPEGNYMLSKDPAVSSGGSYNDLNAGAPLSNSWRALTITSNTTLMGAGRDCTRLVLWGWDYRMLSTASNVTIEHIAFEGGDRLNVWSKFIDSGATIEVSIRNCIVEKFGGTTFQLSNNSAKWDISHNLIRFNWDEAIAPVNNSNEHTIIGNDIHDNGLNGVGINGSRSRVIGNHIWNNGTRGRAPESHGSDINGVLVFQSTAVNADDNVVANNVIYGNGGAGMYCVAPESDPGATCHRNMFIGNNVWGNDSYGMWVEGTADGVVVTGNTLRANGQSGVVVVGPVNDLRITNNMIDGNGVTATSGGVLWVFRTATGTHPIIQGNTIKNTTGWGIWLNAGGSTGSDNEYIHGNEVYGNTSGQILGWSTTAVVRANDGYNPPMTNVAPAVPATTVAVQNLSGFDVTAYVVGGTISDIQVGPTSTTITTGRVTTPADVRLPAGAWIKLTYSGAPTWRWLSE